MTLRAASVALACLLRLGAIATAAETAKPPAPAAPAKPAEAQPAAPPYENDLLRLAELMGTLDYLRDLCGETDAGQWRDRMTALLAATTDAGEKARLAGAFNHGFQSYEWTHRSCTEAARLVVTRAAGEAVHLAHGLEAQGQH